MAETMFDLRSVCFAYEEGGPFALENITLCVPKGAFYAILGRNGSGKSTLAKLLNGLYTPTSGTVSVCGMDTKDEKHTWAIRQKAGMIFQNPDNQLVATQVREDVAFGLENIGIPAAEMPARIAQALEDAGIAEYAERAPHTLSGGQKQRVAIAGVLAMQPEAIIFDESTAMLDPQGRNEVLSAARRLNREKGITVLWITHYMEEAAQFDRLFILHQGHLALDGEPRAIFADEAALAAYGLTPPPMARLANELRREGYPLRAGVLTPEEMAEEVRKLCR